MQPKEARGNCNFSTMPVTMDSMKPRWHHHVEPSAPHGITMRLSSGIFSFRLLPFLLFSSLLFSSPLFPCLLFCSFIFSYPLLFSPVIFYCRATYLPFPFHCSGLWRVWVSTAFRLHVCCIFQTDKYCQVTADLKGLWNNLIMIWRLISCRGRFLISQE